MGWIDSKVLELRFPAVERRRWPGRRRPAGPLHPDVPVVELPARPGRTELDPVLATRDPHRLIVSGTDPDLAAVLVRLLRTDRLHIEVAFRPPPRTPASAAW
ncbi:MAG TPA: hypothetical protein VNA11_21505, partial [Pseudonocardia sp.]|nr:hypothetical protein [Pseudonocardia sp.]